jgi:hypothetical protein
MDTGWAELAINQLQIVGSEDEVINSEKSGGKTEKRRCQSGEIQEILGKCMYTATIFLSEIG